MGAKPTDLPTSEKVVPETFEEKLRTWLLMNNVPYSAMDQLLVLLRVNLRIFHIFNARTCSLIKAELVGMNELFSARRRLGITDFQKRRELLLALHVQVLS